jgi:hypothetical protein
LWLRIQHERGLWPVIDSMPEKIGFTAEPASDATVNGKAHIANGKGTGWVGDPWNGWMNISFHAKLDQDGSARGNWHHQFRARTAAGCIVVQITCSSVIGNQAWLAGYSTQAGNPDNLVTPIIAGNVQVR